METFPEDVAIAEKMVNGDPDIINSDEFQPTKTKKETWSDIFIDPNKKQKSKCLVVHHLEQTTNFVVSLQRLKKTVPVKSLLIVILIMRYGFSVTPRHPQHQ